MKIYLASRYSRREQMRSVRDELQRLGHTVTTRWLDTEWPGDERGSSAVPPEYLTEYAIKDVEDVMAADCVISFTEDGRTPGLGGRHVEFGIAVALGKRLIVVGYRENIFHHLPQVEFYDRQWELARKLESEGQQR